MEDGEADCSASAVTNNQLNNGEVSSDMANFPDGTITETSENKDDKNYPDVNCVNGDNLNSDDSCSQESDALVIDESCTKQRKPRRKRPGKKSKISSEAPAPEVIPPNPFFNESLFELSQQHEKPNDGKAKNKKRKPKPKLKEYAQYLGLQPTVQFKCSKCGQAGFDSLQTLQEHLVQCNSVQNVGNKSPSSENNCSGFKLTRRVFLCSACGTYYENWNLYMHMLEFHRRYICLYCLGMFSVLEDLCQHIQSRHNLEPGRKNSLDEFFNTYSEPCYVVCCECNKLFSEQDNFFYHNCSINKKKTKQIKPQILPENHITGDSVPELTSKTTDSEISSDKVTEKREETTESTTKMQLNSTAMETEEQSDTLSRDDKQIEKHNNNAVEENLEEKEQLEKTIEEETPINTTHELEQCEDTLSNKEQENSMESCTANETDGDCDKSVYVEDNLCEPMETNVEPPTEVVETRKVPKLSLKLPKMFAIPEPDEESEGEDSDKLTLEVEQIESENENEHEEVEESREESHDRSEESCEKYMEGEIIEKSNEPQEENLEENIDSQENMSVSIDNQMQVADMDIPIVEIELDQPLDKIDVRVLLQKCLKATAPSCIYCNHARKIAVNGKQLGLHAIAEHRYSSIVKSITAEELIPESFNTRIKECLEDLYDTFFNLDSSASDEAVTFSHLFECFQCHYSTTVHKELYLHNRKFHSKNLLLCIMCKSNFYSYSELICHLCPGLYVLDYDLHFRCCMCISDDLPSAFRLMVHLRKRHNVCDVCLEMCHNQYRLSNHVWKHKLHHFCYRCGIAYRNKPDITRHLFWKHGTESVLCKKCLQKKWPHVYHFCVPPTSFTCEECGLILTRAVSLKVHKRIHTNENKHQCIFEGCTEKFISKKLMLKHEKLHREPPEEVVEEVKEEQEPEAIEKIEPEEKKEEILKPKPKIDVYDLPELNLSESDSDSEPESKKEQIMEIKVMENKVENEDTTENEDKLEAQSNQNVKEDKTVENESEIIDPLLKEDESNNAVIQNIWDNFKNYQASKEKLDHMFAEPEKVADPIIDIPIPIVEEPLTADIALRDHDYCVSEQKIDTSIIEVKPALTLTERVDHDYCFHKEEGVVAGKPPIEETVAEKSESTKKQPSSSSSSSDTGSSCSCGPNCSCSSSSGSSSSSSDSSDSDSSTEEGRQRQQIRRQKRRERNKVETIKKVKQEAKAKEEVLIPGEITINESDLETTESETDEEFYDREPQKIAKKLLDEKRAKLLAELGPNSVPNGTFIESTSRPPTPPAGSIEDIPKQKKKKLKKRKKKKEKKSVREYNVTPSIPPYYQQFHQQQQQPVLPPITLSLKPTNSPRNSPVRTPGTPPILMRTEATISKRDLTDSNLRASKRRRVPNKFYGYSSDEEEKKMGGHSAPKWRKIESTQAAPRSPLTVPPITIKTGNPQSPHPTVEPISIRLPPTSHSGDFKVKQRPKIPPIRILSPKPPPPPLRPEAETETDSNESDGDQMEQVSSSQPPMPKPNQPQLYCYCRCPYDEVSEMIGCDSSECEIEWFHFECVGIMVPPKGQWFCPDCRKKKQQRALLAS